MTTTLTGSESARDTAILSNWLCFEPISDERFCMSGGVYSMPIGATTPANFSIYSGTFEFDSGSILIEKTKYVFESKDDADKFILELGIDNIVCYYETNYFDATSRHSTIWHTVEVINHPEFNLETNLFNFEEKRGFRIEVLKQISNSSQNYFLESMDRKFIDDSHHGIISEPFLMYFDIKENDN